MPTGIKSIKARYIVLGLLISLASLCVVTVASCYVSHSVISRQLDMRMQAMAAMNASELNLWFSTYEPFIAGHRN